ncbi:MAG: hypothetical protein ACREGF_06380 [Candidatus Saccharimonadales bacterium]
MTTSHKPQATSSQQINKRGSCSPLTTYCLLLLTAATEGSF